MSDALAPKQQTLLEGARAEAKRVGHAAAGLLHLAALLAKRDPQAIDSALGDGSAAALRSGLASAEPPADETELLKVLRSLPGTDPARIVEAVKDSIATTVAALRDEAETDAAPEQRVGRSRVALTGLFRPIESPRSCYEREDAVDEVIALLSRRKPATPLLVGPHGSGKTCLLGAISHRLSADGYTGPLAGQVILRAGVEAVLAQNPIEALVHGLRALEPGAIAAVDDLDAALALGGSGVIASLLPRLRAAVEDPDVRLLLVIDADYLARLEGVDRELTAELTQVDLPELSVESLQLIAESEGDAIAAHHHVSLPARIRRLALAPAAAADRQSHPGLLVQRLDGACARAALRGTGVVSEDDLGLDRSPEIAPPSPVAVIERLQARVKGQDAALRSVAGRLAVTRARLDLRPERPDGVFLFVGPTGVGKTELAKGLAEELFGREDHLIRLDMSEYAHDWAVSRLIGPQPGYVGSNEPESWLTTRIRQQPDTVLLLDEIEKAHPIVWNTFLQVFDAGRLSDSRGAVADFSSTVVVMTSNLGASSFVGPPVGFAPSMDEQQAADAADERVLGAVRERMPPELVNRLDEVVVFRPLTVEAIEDIARREVALFRDRVVLRGYRLEIGDEVIKLVATSGYDPAYGARHLQRNIERLLIQPLAVADGHDLRAVVVGGRVVWEPDSAQ